MSRIHFTNANLLDGNAPARPGATIVVEGDRIVAIARGGDYPPPRPGDIVHDLAGATLMPGMVSGHFHTTYHNLGAEPGVMLMEEPPAFVAYRGLGNAQIALASGFTSVVGAGSICDVDDALRRAIEKGLFVGPRIVPCGRDLFSSADPTLPYWVAPVGDPVLSYCDGPDEVMKTVRVAIRRGARIIKMFVSGGHGAGYKGIRNFTNAEIRACVDAAHDRGARVRAHVVGKSFILECIAAGVDVLDHCDDMDDECIDAMLKGGSFVLPSLYLPTKMLANALFTWEQDKIKADRDAMCAILPRAAAAGVKLCVGDDYGAAGIPHGEYNGEMAFYVDHAGVSALEVLKWATRNGGELMGRGEELGTIEVGKLADLLVVDGDPSRDITILGDRSRLLHIMLGGRFVGGSRQKPAETAGGGW